MKPTGVSSLVTVLLALAVVGLCVARLLRSQGVPPLTVPVGSMVLLVGIAVAVLVVAWPVRKWTRGGVRSPFFTPLRAARAAVMAKAACYCGVALAGWWGGQALYLLPDADIESLRRLLWRLVIGVVLGLGTSVAGLVAESWCRLPGDEDGPVPDEGALQPEAP